MWGLTATSVGFLALMAVGWVWLGLRLRAIEPEDGNRFSRRQTGSLFWPLFVAFVGYVGFAITADVVPAWVRMLILLFLLVVAWAIMHLPKNSRNRAE